MNKLLTRLAPYLTTINLIAAIVAINVVAALFPTFRLDLTSNKIHSLSPATIKIVRDLKDVVGIKVYLSQELPPQVKPLADDLKTILTEFSSINSGRFKVTYVDPITDEKAKTDAAQLGIQPLQFSSIKSDKMEVSTGYLGLAINYQAKQEVLPVAGDVGNLEYYLVSSLRKITANKPTTVALTNGHGEVGTDSLQILGKFLSQGYAVSEVNPSTSEIPNNADVLLMIGPKTQFDSKAVDRISGWVKANKGMIALIDRYGVDNTLTATKVPPLGIENLLKDEGFSINETMVLDASSPISTFRSNNGTFNVQYPYWVEVRPENFDRSTPATSGVNSLLLPWASPLEIGNMVKSLVTSSEASWNTSVITDITPNNKPSMPAKDQLKKQVLAAIRTDGARMAVVGDADFITDNFVANDQQNLYMLMNLVDYLAQDQSLLTIRSKSVANPPIKLVDDQTKQILRWSNVVMPIILLSLLAIFISRRRKKQSGLSYEQ